MQLTCDERTLWKKIETFDLDDPSADFSFTKRLARDNNWGLAYADGVVTEYKKFMFLAVVAGHTVTPSEQVDQAWHLHLIYTRSYWDEFCDGILKKAIHHGPTKGAGEQEKFVDLYELTRQSYCEKFGQAPPVDIWPVSQIRFDRKGVSKWISTKEYWVVRKPNFSKLASWQSLPVVSAAILPALFIGWSPFQLAGKSFLIFYFLLTVFAAVLTYVLQRLFRADGESRWKAASQKSTKLPAHHLACLSGGDTQVLQSAVSELIVGGFAKTLRQQLLVGDRPVTDTRLAKMTAVASHIYRKLHAQSSINNSEIWSVAKLPVARIRGDLAQAGLVQTRIGRYAIAWMSFLIMFTVFGIGVARIVQASGTGRPIGFLVIEMLAVIAVGAMLILLAPKRTKKGDEVLADAKAKVREQVEVITEKDANSREIGLLVGLFGTSILAGTDFSSFEKEIQHVLSPKISTSGGGSSGCGGGCGGGGCGGGGCGGCGGCGG